MHTIGCNMGKDAATPLGQDVKASCSTDAYWIRSWYAPEEGKFYCEWDAKDADAVRQAFTAAVAKAGMSFPLDRVCAIAATFDGESSR